MSFKTKVFKFFRNDMDTKPEVEEEKVNIDDAIVEIDGEKVPLSEVIAAYKEEKTAGGDEGGEDQGNVINPDDEVDIDGQKVLASELIASYQRRASKANAEPPTDTKAEEVVDETKQKSNTKKDKPNENFKNLNNAIKNSFEEFSITVQSKDERIKAGKKKYGSGKEAKE